MIMGNDKSQGQQSANQKSRRTNGVFQSECQQAWDPGRANISIQVWKQEKKKVPSQKQAGRRTPLIHGRDSYFVLLRPSTD